MVVKMFQVCGEVLDEEKRNDVISNYVENCNLTFSAAGWKSG